MSSRERILTSLDHKEPDRVPIVIGNIYEQAYRRLCKYLGLRLESVPQTYSIVTLIDKKIREKFALDNFVNVSGLVNFGRFFTTHMVEGFCPEMKKAVEYECGLIAGVDESSKGIFTDEYGCKFQYKGVGGPYPIYHPLKNAKTISDVEKYARWPDPEDPSRISRDANKIVKKLHDAIDGAFYTGVLPIFHRYQHLRGFNQWLIDMKLNPELYKAITEKILYINLRLTMRSLNEIGEYVDLLALNDDMGATVSPFMSVEDYRKSVKPYYKELVETVRKEFPKIKVWYHCHGSVLPLVPDIIECGIDVLNPVLPRDNMEPNILKKEFGGKLSFDGAIDIQQIVPFGSTVEVREHLKKVMKVLAPGGGYIARAQIINPITPPENICALYEAALEYGRYPIDCT